MRRLRAARSRVRSLCSDGSWGSPVEACATSPLGASVAAGYARFADDQRGAIVVLGVFMAVFLVGIVWYVAGIGDAIIYRERLQEAADATAFSSAVVMARGMNIIVLINLLMAAVLAIRVALKTAQLALGIGAAVFAAIALIPGAEAAALVAEGCVDAAETVQSTLDSINPTIDNTLTGLSNAAEAVKTAVPIAAAGAGIYIASKYAPTTTAVAVPVYPLIKPDDLELPVEKGSTTVLCDKAKKAVTEVVKYAFSKMLGGVIGGAAGTLVGLLEGIPLPDFYCALGGGGEAPNMGKENEKSAEGKCKGKVNKLSTAEEDARRKKDELRKELRIDAERDPDLYLSPGDCVSDPDMPSCIAQSRGSDRWSTAVAEQENAAREVGRFDYDQCTKDALKDCRDKQTKIQKNRQKDDGAAKSGNGKEPHKVKSGWFNGTDDAQWIWVLNGTAPSVASSRLVQMAGYDKVKTSESEGPHLAAAQSEFFYDCDKDWKQCDEAEEAMWNFRWRPRLRLLNLDLIDKSKVAGRAVFLLKVAPSLSLSFDPTLQGAQNLALKAKLLAIDRVVIH
ncbi:MAG: hypothetical protein NVSMB1_06530 [Polyangiales bacterium]